MGGILNYIRAELYKVSRDRRSRIFLVVMVVLELLFILLWQIGEKQEFYQMAAILCSTMEFGGYLSIVVAALVLSGPYSSRTLKNELTFGLTRERIYLGKLLSAALVGLALSAAVIAFYLGVSWVLTGHSDPSAIRTSLGILGYVAAASVPLWLGTLGIVVAVFFLMRGETGAITLLVIGMTIGMGLLYNLQELADGPVQSMAGFLRSIMPLARFEGFYGALTTEMMLENWGIGLGWFAASALLGCWRFREKEIQ